MPMCYMYRNAVELGLKRIIVESSHIERAKALKVLQKRNIAYLVFGIVLLMKFINILIYLRMTQH